MRPEPLLLVLLALSASLSAAPPAETKPQHKDAREAEASAELLEFLGSWETATGAWSETVPDNEGVAKPATRRPKEKTRND